MQRVASLDDVVTFVQAARADHVLIFDVDNTLVRQGAPLDEFGHRVNAAIDRFESMPGVVRVIVLTNGAQRGVPRMISRGNKPWTSRRRLGLRGVTYPVVVVGDQILTDGLLAWRLQATLLHLVIDRESEPRRQAVMRWAGRLVGFVVLRSHRGGWAR
jgi:predicted HAD superfamily phosphohydrolase YqeG